MSFVAERLVVRVYRSDGGYFDVKCPTIENARVVLSMHTGHSEIVANY